jgi:hypothetical protein
MKNLQCLTRAALFMALSAIGVSGSCLAADSPAPRKTSETMKKMDSHVHLLFNEHMGDPSICLGPDGTYYLTGTLYRPGWTNTIQMWKSKDLKQWERLDFVWKPGDSPWHKKYAGCAVCAPKIH